MAKIKVYTVITLAAAAFFAAALCLYLSDFADKSQKDEFNKFKEIKNANSVSLREARFGINAGDFTGEARISSGTLKIFKGEELFWQSPDNWWVDDFLFSDLTNDGKSDIGMSVYKSGSFGSSMPFWIKENDKSVKNHFFVFNLSSSGLKAIWQSSNLDNPNCKIIAGDSDDDLKTELIVLEGEYRADYGCNPVYAAVWKWNGWGFANEWRSKKGSYENIKIEKNGDKSYIAVY